MGNGISFGSDENVLNLISMMAVQLCEYVKNTELHTLNECGMVCVIG